MICCRPPGPVCGPCGGVCIGDATGVGHVRQAPRLDGDGQFKRVLLITGAAGKLEDHIQGVRNGEGIESDLHSALGWDIHELLAGG